MGWEALVISGGHGGGTEEGKAEGFTVFITLCRLNLLSVSSLEGGEKQSWCARIVQKHTSYVGTASNESGASKEEKVFESWLRC